MLLLVYFILIGILETIRAISITQGQPTIYFSLVIIVLLSLLKEGYQDLKRFTYDRQENNMIVEVLTQNGWISKKSGAVTVGQIIKINCDQNIMADCLLLKQSQTTYIETKSLDGETNLKIKTYPRSLSYLQNLNQKQLFSEHFKVQYERPTQFLHTFSGQIKIQDRTQNLSIDNLLLRGSKLKITQQAIALVLYNGKDTKVMLNSTNSKIKQSTLQYRMNIFILGIFIIQLILTFFCALVSALVLKAHSRQRSYLSIVSTNFVLEMLVSWGTWILIFSNFVPISLLVTLSALKLFQATFLHNEKFLYSKLNSTKPYVNSSSLNDQLGQVQYVLSDKTGTLTCNSMLFKYLWTPKKVYGKVKTMQRDDLLKRPIVTHVDFGDRSLIQQLQNQACLKQIMIHLSVCHSVIPYYNEQKQVFYNSSSADQLALVSFAKFCGYQFYSCKNNKIIVNIQNKEQLNYKILQILPFTSQRKRMSVIIQRNDHKILLLSKGADSVMLNNIQKLPKNIKESSLRFLCQQSSQGLRTLVLCEKQLSLQQFQKWNEQYKQAQLSQNTQKKIDLQKQIQKKMELIAMTAVEDKLQPQVPETIQLLKNMGIHVWILTGDKRETAINIGISAGLIGQNMQKIILDCPAQELQQLLQKTKETLQQNIPKALIFTGQVLASNKQGIKQTLFQFSKKCQAVVACRVSPSQKQIITIMLNPHGNTLAIGDGANDINMIAKSNVGIGINGVQGNQAAAAADYSIGEFSILGRLLLCFGRQYYRRNSTFIFYTVYKNMILSIPLFWYAFISGFSGSSLYNPWIIQFYNIIFTVIPIMLYGIFDQQYQKHQIILQSKVYKRGIRNQYFDTRKAGEWLVTTVVTSLLIGLPPVYYIQSQLDSGSNILFASQSGIAISAITVFIANMKIIHFANSYSIGLILSLIISILSYFLVYFIVQIVFNQNIRNTQKWVIGSFQFYGSILIITSIIYILQHIPSCYKMLVYKPDPIKKGLGQQVQYHPLIQTTNTNP